MAAYFPESTSTSILLTAEESTCLSDVLKRSQPLQSFLEASLQQPLSMQTTSMLKDLLNALQMEPNPAHWITNPKLLAALPIVLRFDQLPTLSKSEIDALLTQYLGVAQQKSRYWKALVYPLFMAVVAFVVMIAMGLTILPIFDEMYDDFGLSLPFATEILLSFSALLRDHLILVSLSTLLVVVSLFGFFVGLGNLLRHFQNIGLIGFWFAGSRQNVEAMSRWTSTLAELIDLNFDLTRAIPIAGIASQSRQIQIVSRKLSAELEARRINGNRPIDPSIVIGIPATVVTALFSSSTPSTSLLRQIAYAQQIRLSERQERFGGLLGPITTILVGLMIGFVVIALFMPLISLVTSLS